MATWNVRGISTKEIQRVPRMTHFTFPGLVKTCWQELAAHYPVLGLAHSRSASRTTQSLFLFISLRLSLHVQLIY
jgi:hypothetical protein